MQLIPVPVVFAKEGLAERIKGALPARTIVVRRRAELFGACFTPGAVAFVDFDLLDMIDGANMPVPIIAIMDVPAATALQATIAALETYPWLAHVVQAPLLAMERARLHFDALLERIGPSAQRALGVNAMGRTALLARASRREARFERMRQYFESRGISERMSATLLDVAEELVMNALYNAPLEAGFFAQPHSRMDDVELPPDRACEISYGVEDSTVFVRVRDPFGALKRERLLEVLARCKVQDVQLDESRGGAGLGLRRIFSAASAVSIIVVPGSFTEFTIVLGRADSRRVARPLAVDLHFANNQSASAFADNDDPFLVDQSITFALQRGGSITPGPLD